MREITYTCGYMEILLDGTTRYRQVKVLAIDKFDARFQFWKQFDPNELMKNTAGIQLLSIPEWTPKHERGVEGSMLRATEEGEA